MATSRITCGDELKYRNGEGGRALHCGSCQLATACLVDLTEPWRRVAIRHNRCPTIFFSAVALVATVIFWF